MILPNIQQSKIAWTVVTPQQSSTTTRGWTPWVKPPGCNFVWIIVVGAGQGGASGGAYSSTVGATGGAGGNGGHGLRFMAPAGCLPDTLYLRPGNGGLGGFWSGGIQTAPLLGTNSLVSASCDLTSTAHYLCSVQSSNVTFSSMVGWGLNHTNTTTNGLSGGSNSGGAGTFGGNTSSIFGSAGAGGGGASAAGSTRGQGGDISYPSVFSNKPVRGGQIRGGANTGGAGQDGHYRGMRIDFLTSRTEGIFPSGGSGGGAALNATGGAGGNGSWGSGGGGGGAGGPTESTLYGGNGGNGGDGYIIVGAF